MNPDCGYFKVNIINHSFNFQQYISYVFKNSKAWRQETD